MRLEEAFLRKWYHAGPDEGRAGNSLARPRVVREAMEKGNRGWEVARGLM